MTAILGALNGSNPVVVANILTGAGFGGSSLGQSSPITLTNGAGLATYTFSFGTPISITPGSTYTIRFAATAGTFDYGFSTGNQYTRGQLFIGSGVPASGDLTFSEGLSAAPEPATWGLMILGFGVVGSTLRRRRRVNEYGRRALFTACQRSASTNTGHLPARWANVR